VIIAITGQIGSGKTLTLTYLGYSKYKEGKKILSNYRLKYKHEIISKEVLSHYTDSDTSIKDCTMLIDEMQTVLDCRDSGKKDNKLLSYMILQTRKRGVDLFYTTQQFWNVEIRLRRNTDLLIECRPIYSIVKGKKSLKSILLSFWIPSGSEVMTYKGRKLIKDPSSLFKLYDTYEIIGYK
jgi:hypothetical protein